MKFEKLLVLTLIILTYGCSSKYEVVYDSYPRGALVVCDGSNYGHTPKKLYYDESVKERSSITVNCSAKWVSGAKKDYPRYIKVYPKGGTIVTVERPNNANGYSVDAGYDLQLRQTKAAEKAASEPVNTNTTKSCTKIGDLSGRIYTFSTPYCPVGYF